MRRQRLVLCNKSFMFSITLKSPAKINLFLRTLYRREDGYHELASLFQAIDLFDELTIEKAAHDLLICSVPSLPTDGSNLIWKAVRLFREKTGIKHSFKIHLQKQIPTEAGLGGGSSNAATTLWGLNRLCGSSIAIETLAEWGAELGSDVPFFFSSGTAYCTGRGEKVDSLSPLPARRVWIVKPEGGLPTPAVYKKLDLDQLVKRDPKSALKQIFEGKNCFFNDLEVPAFQLMPELAELKSTLQAHGFSEVLMSGSGSSFFCLGEGSLLKQQGISLYTAHFTQRQDNCWYEALSE